MEQEEPVMLSSVVFCWFLYVHHNKVIGCICYECVVFEYLTRNNVSVNMVANYISVIKEKSVIFGLPHKVCDDPSVKYYIKSLKINRLIHTLQKLVEICD